MKTTLIANSELLEENAKLKAEIENLRIKADAYDIACDDLEQYQQSRIASGKHPGTVRSLCDGMAWAYNRINDLESALHAEMNDVANAALRVCRGDNHD